MNDRISQGSFNITSSAEMELVDITRKISSIISDHGFTTGICYLFCPHTTGALTINEGADPDVKRDIISGIQEMVPFLDYRHMEGNSRSHILASLFGPDLSLLVNDGNLLLGTWQKVYFCEFDGPRTRKIVYRLSR